MGPVRPHGSHKSQARVIPDDSGGRVEVALIEGGGRRYPVTTVEVAQYDPGSPRGVASEVILLRLVDASLLSVALIVAVDVAEHDADGGTS